MKKTYVLPSRLNKRLISTLMSDKSTDTCKKKSFSLKSTSEFASRSGDIFGKLQTLEKNHEIWMSQNSTLDSFEEAENRSRGKAESEIFKKPVPTKLWKQKYISNFPFKRRPSKKWKKYSLEDVPITSDANNTAIALSFISELRMRKENTLNSIDDINKIVYTKPEPNEQKFCSFSSKKNTCTHISKCHTVGNLPALKQTVLRGKKDETKSPKIQLHHLQEEEGCDSI